MFVYSIYKDRERDPTSYIQHGNIPIRDSPHRAAPHSGATEGWGGIPYGYIFILDRGYLISIRSYIYIYMYTYIE